LPAFIKNPKNFFSGLMFLAVASLFAYGLQELSIGSALRMGPGYFPLVLVLLIALLGLVLMVNGVWVAGEPFGTIPWRSIALITLPTIFFGATLKGLGLVPSLSLTIFATSFATRRWDLTTSIAVTVCLVAFSWLIFVRGLGLPLALLGPWVGGY
jgi:putative tricarboxylic transport membrane protein